MATYLPMLAIISLLHKLFVSSVYAMHIGGPTGFALITHIEGCFDEESGSSLLSDGNINAGECIPSFIAHVIQFLFGFAGGVCLLVIIWSGYEIVIGSLPGGSSEAGKNRITWAIIGFILAATSFFIMDFIITAIQG